MIPPDTDEFIAPVLAPPQTIFVGVSVIEGEPALVTAATAVEVQPIPSVTVTV